jgi:HD-GYP domain-containing protein (c-di-GMP phosphodiesterase class II)
MAKQRFAAIAAASIEAGPVPFNLYTKDEDGHATLYLRAGLGFTPQRKGILKELERVFYITSEERDSYLEYASERLERIVNNPEIRVSDKAMIVYGVGKRTVQRLMEDPRSGTVMRSSRRLVEGQVALIFSSPEAAAQMFELSAFDAYTFSHSINVCTFCIMLGEKLFGRDKAKLWELGMAGLLHDVGKSRIAAHILEKETCLNAEEWEVMKRHTIFSYEIITEHSLPKAVADAGRHHHERLDGSGYPDGLSGWRIHPTARVVSVADIYDALTSDRPYKSKMKPLEALHEIAATEPHIDKEAFNALLQSVLRNMDLVHDFQANRLAGVINIG